MKRGTTPTNTFKTNIDLTGATVFVTYAQGGKTVLEKTGPELEITKDAVSLRLTQADTLASLDFSVFVPVSRKINGKDLSADRTLTGADISVSGSDATKINTALAAKAGASAATQSAAGLMSAADKKKLDGVAASATSNSASSTTPKAAGTAAVGTEAAYARGDHVHPAQTTVSGNAGSATKLANARTIRTNLASTSTASFDGTGNVAPGVTGVLGVPNGGTGSSAQNFIDLTTDQTVAGVKTLSGITKHTNNVQLVNTSVKGTAPSSNNYRSIYVFDKEGTATANRVGGFEVGAMTDGSNRVYIRAYKPEKGSTVNAAIQMNYGADGKVTVTLPGTTSGTFSGDGAALTGLNAANVASGTLPVEWGGTGAATPAAALTALGAAPSGFGLGDLAIAISNLDDCSGTGFYRISKTNANANHGINSALVVLHMEYNSTYIGQIALATQLDGVFYRRMNAGTWQAWKKVTLTAL